MKKEKVGNKKFHVQLCGLPWFMAQKGVHFTLDQEISSGYL